MGYDVAEWLGTKAEQNSKQCGETHGSDIQSGMLVPKA